jgi:UDP-glucose 4-epimerase
MITLSIEIKGWGLVVGQESSILVTGAEGFIGSHVVEVLAKTGINVRALCQYNSFGSIGWLGELSSEFSDNVEIVFGDVRDADQMRRYVNGCSSVVNLAALIAIPFSYLAGRSYADVNTLGTLNLLEAVRENSIRMIQISTSEIYGTPQTTPITELHPVNPQSPYAASKAAADHFVMSYFDSFDMDLLIVRPFNTYGPRLDSHDGRVVSTFIRQAINGEALTVNGDGNQTRSFCYITDLIDGIFKMAESHEFGPINLGNPNEMTLNELIKEISKLLSKNLDTTNLPELKDDPVSRKPDISLAKEKLGWETKVSLTQGLQLLINSQ